MSRVFTSIALAAIGLSAAAATGCGYRSAGDDTSASTKAAPSHSAPKPRVKGLNATATDSGGGSSSGSMVFFSGEQPEKSKPVRDLYSVLSRPRGKRDLAAEAAARDAAYPAQAAGMPEGAIGEPLYRETRMVLDTAEQGFYVLPTTTNSVCWGLIPNRGGGCGGVGEHGLTVAWAEDAGEFVVYGLVDDDVRAVDVVIGDVTRRAQSGENAYLLTVDGAAGGTVENIVLHLRDGTTDTLG